MADTIEEVKDTSQEAGKIALEDEREFGEDGGPAVQDVSKLEGEFQSEQQSEKQVQTEDEKKVEADREKAMKRERERERENAPGKGRKCFSRRGIDLFAAPRPEETCHHKRLPRQIF